MENELWPLKRSAYGSPFGKQSLFYIPDIFLNNQFTIVEIASVSNVLPVNANENFAPDESPEPIDSVDILVIFTGFEFEVDMERFLCGRTVAEYNKTIDRMLEDEAATKPWMIICAYVKKVAISTGLLPVMRFSKGLCQYIESYISSSGTYDLYERVDKWAARVHQLGAAHTGFSYSLPQVDIAFERAVPHDVVTIISRLPAGTNSEEKQQQYNANYKMLVGLAANPADPQTEDAIRNLCKVALELDTSVLQSYNQQPRVRYNSLNNKNDLTANDFYYMARRLRALSQEIKKFQNGEFKTGDEIVAFVNANLVDYTALGAPTQFVINYPFEKISYSRRKEILNLLLDGRSLDFGGFWRRNFMNETISAGDIVFNIFTTANEAEQLQLIEASEKEQKIFDLVNSKDEDFQFAITLLITSAVAETFTKDTVKQSEVLINAIEEQNFYFFDAALNKKQDAEIDTGGKKIKLLNKGHEKVPNSVGRAQLIAKSLEGKNIFEHDSTNSEKREAEYLLQNVSDKTLFNPLDLIAFTAESKVEIGTEIIEKDETVLLPACMVYLLISKGETAKKWKTIDIATALIALPLTITSFVAAVEAAAALGIVVTATDLAVDTAFISANIQGLEKENPDFVKAVNQIAFFYGLARLGYGLAKGLPAILNKNWLQAIKQVAQQSKDLIKQLRSSKTDELFRDVFKLLDKGELSAYQAQRISRTMERITQQEISVVVKLHYVDEGSREFKALYKAWAEATEKPAAIFKPKSGYSTKYAMVVDGPAIYIFKGGSIKPSFYTLQHELFHLKLWFTFVKQGRKAMQLYARIPAWLHEVDVIGEMLKANKRKPGKWNMDEILEDLKTLNRNIENQEIFGAPFRKMTGKKQMELKDLENWNINNWLEKL